MREGEKMKGENVGQRKKQFRHLAFEAFNVVQKRLLLNVGLIVSV